MFQCSGEQAWSHDQHVPNPIYVSNLQNSSFPEQKKTIALEYRLWHSSTTNSSPMEYEIRFIWSSKTSETIEENIVLLLFYVHGKHLRSCRDGQLT